MNACENPQQKSATKSRSIERTEIKQLLTINNSDLQMIKKASPTNDVHGEDLRFGKIHHGIPLEIANCQSDLVAVGTEATSSGPDSFPYTSL